MTDVNSLLPQTGSAESETQPPLMEVKQHRPSLEDTIEHCIGDFGWPQIFQAILVSFAWFFDAQQTFISVFTDSEPKWSCTDTNFSSSCNSSSNLCQIPKDAWSWDSPASTSIISEWSLECEGSIIRGLPASSFFLGCLFGGFALATLADSVLGRKNMLVLSGLLMSIAGVLTAASSNLWMYAVLRFISGLGRATVGTCALVLSTELVGKKWRQNIGIVGFICFALGFLYLPLVAYFLRGSSWRLIYLWTSVPSLIYSSSLYFLARESPRWLFIKGRKEELAETLRSLASPANRTSLNQSFFERCSHVEEVSKEPDVFSSLKMLLRKGWSSRRLLAVMVVAFGNGVIYYGMPLGLGNLSLNIYLSVTLNALSEIPSSFLTFILIEKLDRKVSVVGLALLSGICSVSCVLVGWKGMQMVLEVVSFFGGCTSFSVVSIYTLELFPTCVRNSAVAMVRQALVLGGSLSPVLVAAGRSNNGLLSYGVFGVMISICGLFVACLPETRGRLSSNTMEEEERKNAGVVFN